MMKSKLFIIFISLSFSDRSFAKEVNYELNIENKMINISGKKFVDFALMVNGGIPAPTLEFTEGDDAIITVKNSLKDQEVSIHWHGILLPPSMDGVPYVNTPPILPGQSFTFEFKIRQHGTYWYHSHTSVQEQKGVYGALVIHPQKKLIKADKDLVVVLSDWSDENADQIMNNLRKDGDYYLYKKNSIRSYFGAAGEQSLGSHLTNEWTRMGAMDLSDVGYDAFLINGKIEQQLVTAHPGEKIRVRIINAAASSYFYISLGQSPMTVIASDGIDIKPTLAKEILIGMAETYDILFTVPEHKNFELRATSQDVKGYATGWIGMGSRVSAPDKKKPNLYLTMNHGDSSNHEKNESDQSGHGAPNDRRESEHKSPQKKHEAESNSKDHHSDHSMDEMINQKDSMESKSESDAIETLTVENLSAQQPTNFPKDKKSYELKLVLGGDMERYIWHINGKAIHEDRNITINEGDVVRFTFENETMMHHPMHLHGHFFRVLNESGDHSPLKHTVDIPPHETRTIEFLADEPGQWMLHCHNLYHLKTGMARVVRYFSYKPIGKMAEYDKKDPHLKQHIYFNGMAEAATNHAQLHFNMTRTWDSLETRFETREYDSLDHIEGDLFYRRWYSNFFSLVLGGTHYSQYPEDATRGVVGVSYTLPMLVETNLLIDHMGKVRFDIEKKFQWTKSIYSDAEMTFRQNQNTEFEVTLMYANSWNWAAGLMFTEDSVGVGAQYRF